MKRRKLHSTSGVTLMEVTLSVAIFAVVIAMSAQALMGFYASVDMQEQRVEALQAARTVLADIRLKRTDFELPDDQFDWEGLRAWIQERQEGEWAAYTRDHDEGNLLEGHQISVIVTNMDGEEPNGNDNPLQIRVNTSWLDMRGRRVSATIATVIAER